MNWKQIILTNAFDRGILSVAWCQRDPDLLLSCGKDNRILCWNPNSSVQTGEVSVLFFLKFGVFLSLVSCHFRTFPTIYLYWDISSFVKDRCQRKGYQKGPAQIVLSTLLY